MLVHVPQSPAAFNLLIASVAFSGLWGCDDCTAPTAGDVPREVAAPRPPPAPDIIRWTSLDPPATPGALGASLTATTAGVLATWVEPRPQGGHALRFATLHGETWTEATTVVEAEDLFVNWADFPRAALGGDGAVYVHYLHRSGASPYAYEVQLTRSRDQGQTFEALGVVHHDGTATEHGFVSMVPAPDGLRLFWLDGRGTGADDGAMSLYTTRVGEAVEEAEPLDGRVCDCCQTDAAITGGGPVVVFRDRGEEELRDIGIVRWANDRFTEPSSVHEDGWTIAGCPVNGPAVAADGEHLAVAWFTGADGGSLQVAFSEDGGASFAAPVTVDPNQPPGRVDVALLDGGAAVSWLARTRGGGEVRVRYVGRDGHLGASTTVAETAIARASGFPVLARDGERLLVAYRDAKEEPAAYDVHVASLAISALPRTPGEREAETTPPPLSLGDPMPDATLLNADDHGVSLSAVAAGAPMVVAFFARWCQPCRAEMQHLEELSTRLGSTVKVVAVSLDEGSVSRVTATARGWGFSHEVLRDGGAAAALGVPPIPALFFFDGSGILRGAWRGEVVEVSEVEEVVALAAGAHH